MVVLPCCTASTSGETHGDWWWNARWLVVKRTVTEPGCRFQVKAGCLTTTWLHLIIIIIVYIYHALINALSAHMIHINLNMIFHTHVEHSPTKTIYIKYYTKKAKKKKKSTTNTYKHITHTHNDCSRNWVLILVRMEILWEEEGFQFGFKIWQGWAVSKVLWGWISNAGSKAREGAKAMSLVFVLLDFQHASVRRRA